MILKKLSVKSLKVEKIKFIDNKISILMEPYSSYIYFKYQK